MIKRNCKQCGVEFSFRNCPSDIKNGGGKYCGKKCLVKSMDKKIKKICIVCSKEYFVHKYRANKSKTCSFECRDKMYTTGLTWKGDMSGYYELHYWVRSRLGNEKICEKCGTKTAKKYEWANKSHKYKRELDDWMRLCISCHRRYDLDSKK